MIRSPAQIVTPNPDLTASRRTLRTVLFIIDRRFIAAPSGAHYFARLPVSGR